MSSRIGRRRDRLRPMAIRQLIAAGHDIEIGSAISLEASRKAARRTVLDILAEAGGPITAARITEASGLSPSRTVRVLKGLLKSGGVGRTWSADRGREYFLSPKRKPGAAELDA